MEPVSDFKAILSRNYLIFSPFNMLFTYICFIFILPTNDFAVLLYIYWFHFDRFFWDTFKNYVLSLSAIFHNIYVCIYHKVVHMYLLKADWYEYIVYMASLIMSLFPGLCFWLKEDWLICVTIHVYEIIFCLLDTQK